MQKDFKKLILWQEAMRLTKLVYEMTREFPADEKFGLISQMRRAAVSIPSNIAEGSGRATNAQFAHFLAIAQGSAFELETQILLAESMHFVTSTKSKEALEVLQYVQRMNFKLKQSLTTKK